MVLRLETTAYAERGHDDDRDHHRDDHLDQREPTLIARRHAASRPKHLSLQTVVPTGPDRAST